ncbi:MULTISPECIES: TRAP transporter substrate-binding protein [Thalassospira]|uniref:TRAP transporter substrate-binding protein n=1 Tax=Thalassospira TaxID=168934 RepID=UPI001113E51B|nr:MULTISPECIES: TRAP transporter substrate-binding protein [Thalassospira]MDM7976702.1 TRAP transporter substrate-binding protein [Thalassospira xiamenensis]
MDIILNFTHSWFMLDGTTLRAQENLLLEIRETDPMRYLMLALAACVLTTTTFAADAQTLRLSTQGNPPHPWLDAAETLKSEVETATNGRVKIEIFGGATLGRDATALDEMRLGTIDLLIGGTQEATPFFPEFQLFSISYLFPNIDIFRKAMAPDSEVVSYFNRVYEQSENGLKLLALTGGGIRNLSNNQHEVANLEDLSGLKMRVPGSRLDAVMWETSGAQPVSLPFTELYTALQTGVANAFESSISAYVGNKLYEVAPYHSMTQHQFLVSHITISSIAWNRLSNDDKEIFRAAAAKAAVVGIDKGIEYDSSLLQPLIDSGKVTVTEVDKTPFIEVVRPLHDEVAKEIGATEVLNAIRALK